MQLIDAFVRNPVKVAVGVLLVVLFGIIALMRMPMQLTPEVQTPTITIRRGGPAPVRRKSNRRSSSSRRSSSKSVEGRHEDDFGERRFAGHDHARIPTSARTWTRPC